MSDVSAPPVGREILARELEPFFEPDGLVHYKLALAKLNLALERQANAELTQLALNQAANGAEPATGNRAVRRAAARAVKKATPAKKAAGKKAAPDNGEG